MATYDSNVTGQAFRPKSVEPIVTALPFGITTKAKLDNKAAGINIEEISGKKEGAMVIVQSGTAYHVAIAKGNLPESPWSLMALGSTFTPV